MIDVLEESYRNGIANPEPKSSETWKFYKHACLGSKRMSDPYREYEPRKLRIELKLCFKTSTEI